MSYITKLIEKIKWFIFNLILSDLQKELLYESLKLKIDKTNEEKVNTMSYHNNLEKDLDLLYYLKSKIIFL